MTFRNRRGEPFRLFAGLKTGTSFLFVWKLETQRSDRFLNFEAFVIYFQMSWPDLPVLYKQILKNFVFFFLKNLGAVSLCEPHAFDRFFTSNAILQMILFSNASSLSFSCIWSCCCICNFIIHYKRHNWIFRRVKCPMALAHRGMKYPIIRALVSYDVWFVLNS